MFKIKRIIAQLICWNGIGRYAIKHGKFRLILAFHRIIERREAELYALHPSMQVSPHVFRMLLAWLKRLGTFVDLKDLLKNDHPDSTLISVTFDDGWIDTYTNAMPVLVEMNIPATVFISSGLTDSGAMNWTEEVAVKYKESLTRDAVKSRGALGKLSYEVCGKSVDDVHDVIEALKLYNLSNRNEVIKRLYSTIGCSNEPILGHMLNWDHLRAMKKNGFSVGSHTESHIILDTADLDDIKSELISSKNTIENALDSEITFFSYPNARYTEISQLLLKEAGYKYGFTLDNRCVTDSSDPYYIPRFLVYDDIYPILACRILQIPGF